MQADLVSEAVKDVTAKNTYLNSADAKTTETIFAIASCLMFVFGMVARFKSFWKTN